MAYSKVLFTPFRFVTTTTRKVKKNFFVFIFSKISKVTMSRIIVFLLFVALCLSQEYAMNYSGMY